MAKDAVLFRWDREGHANVGWMNANIAHKSAIDAPFGLLFAVSFANVAEMKRQRRPIHAIVAEARSALSMSQREFGEAVGSSHRSAVRWDAGQASPGEHHLHTLAKLLHPVDRSLAAEVADAADETLEGLGLETPLVPAPPPPAAPPLPCLLYTSRRGEGPTGSARAACAARDARHLRPGRRRTSATWRTRAERPPSRSKRRCTGAPRDRRPPAPARALRGTRARADREGLGSAGAPRARAAAPSRDRGRWEPGPRAPPGPPSMWKKTATSRTTACRR